MFVALDYVTEEIYLFFWNSSFFFFFFIHVQDPGIHTCVVVFFSDILIYIQTMILK